jgi:nitrogen regulatory protein P-II 1
MKLIIAIIQPHKLENVKKALYNKGVNLLSVDEVIGHSCQKVTNETYHGHSETGIMLRKIRLEIAVNDNFVTQAVEAITTGARSGEIGDGKIFILPLEECIRIRTGETGSNAIG